MERIPLKWDGKQCGVYCIKNKMSGKIYIGSSKNCYHRVRSQHFDKLRLGTHNNPHLQASWNKYGKSSFESFCVELCGEDVLVDREQVWIDKTGCLDRNVGYNINPYADRTELTPEQCKNVSLGKLGQSRQGDLPSGIRRQNNKYGVSWYALLTFRNREYHLGNFRSFKTATMVRNYALPLIIKGVDLDWEWIKSLRTSTRKPVLQLDKEGNVIKRFEYLGQTASDGFLPTSVSNCIAGRCRTYRGFGWRFA